MCCGVESKDEKLADTLKSGATIVDARSPSKYEESHIDGRLLRRVLSLEIRPVRVACARPWGGTPVGRRNAPAARHSVCRFVRS